MQNKEEFDEKTSIAAEFKLWQDVSFIFIEITNELNKNPLINLVNLKGYNFERAHEDSVNSLFRAIEKNKNLKKLTFDQITFSDKYATDFANILQNNTSITNLTLMNLDLNNLNEESIKALFNSFNKNIEILNFTCCTFSNESIIALANVLKDNKSIKNLNLSGLDLSNLSEEVVKTLFSSFSNLETLDLSGIIFSQKNAAILANNLSSYKFMKNINLSNIDLFSIDEKLILDAIENNINFLNIKISLLNGTREANENLLNIANEIMNKHKDTIRKYYHCISEAIRNGKTEKAINSSQLIGLPTETLTQILDYCLEKPHDQQRLKNTVQPSFRANATNNSSNQQVKYEI